MPLTPNDFTNSPKVRANLQLLRKSFSNDRERPFIVSDTLDNKGNQYVNLVQKGGGVLGIALVGYTYVLEEMGIRFLRLAGTSAGAINTAMLTIIGNKNEAKSTKVLQAITALNFFNLVDGHPVAKWVIKNFITHKKFLSRIKTWIMIILLTSLLLLVGSFISLWLVQYSPSILYISKIIITVFIIFIILLAEGISYTRNLLRRFKNSGYGINPGTFFYKWMKDRMEENGVNNVETFNEKASQSIPGLHTRFPHPEGIKALSGDVTFICSELVTQNKIEFPKMCNLFREKDKIDIHPAAFVRASMSIPLFFESYFIKNIPSSSKEIKENWMEIFGENDPPHEARFVDGGILSNFPISLFYNPKVLVPRLPTFGIDLDDSKPEDNYKSAENWSLIGYFGRIFNTIRNYYDKDFQIKNRVYSQGIGTIPLSEFNWLNFFLTDQEKITMFEKGAQAATDFLLKFNWEKYKNDRATMQSNIEGNVG